jgi:hypothetical protein
MSARPNRSSTGTTRPPAPSWSIPAPGTGRRCWLLLDGLELDEPAGNAAALLATVLGQDITQDQDGHFTIVRGTAADRVISTVDPETRHGHKTSARGFDGYKGHIAVDPDSEIITATTVTPGNSGDADAAEALLADILSSEAEAELDFPIVGSIHRLDGQLS